MNVEIYKMWSIITSGMDYIETLLTYEDNMFLTQVKSSSLFKKKKSLIKKKTKKQASNCH